MTDRTGAGRVDECLGGRVVWEVKHTLQSENIWAWHGLPIKLWDVG
jgi:hypothetical protein